MFAILDGFFGWFKSARTAGDGSRNAKTKIQTKKNVFKLIRGLFTDESHRERRACKASMLTATKMSGGDGGAIVEPGDSMSAIHAAADKMEEVYILKVVLLLMDPETRRFELLQLEFDSLKALVSDVLAQIPISVTEKALRLQKYTGIAGKDGIEMTPYAFLGDFCKGNEVLVAISDVMTAKECVGLARPILSDDKVVDMLTSSGIDASGWKEEDPVATQGIVGSGWESFDAQKTLSHAASCHKFDETKKKYFLKAMLLLMDPERRRFEFMYFEFDSLKALVTDVLAQILISVTEEALRLQKYTGIAGKNGIKMTPFKVLADFCKGNEVLVAIPDGLSTMECVRLARPILSDNKVVDMLASSGIYASGWKEDPKKNAGVYSGQTKYV